MEAFGQRHLGYGQPAQAKGAPAAFAEEMGVQVGQTGVHILAAMTVFRAQSILGLPTSVVHGVHQMVLEKNGKGTKNRGLVYCAEPGLEVAERQGTVGLPQGTQDEQPQGRRPDAAM